MTILMKIRGLQKSFGEQTILKNIDFDISNQERIGFWSDTMERGKQRLQIY